MFANVMNSYDFDLLHSFIQRFTVPEVQFMKSSNCSLINISGKNLLYQYFMASLQLTPDKVMSITDTKIKQRSDTAETELVSTYQLKFTKLYDYNPGRLVDSLLKNFDQLSVDVPPSSSAVRRDSGPNSMEKDGQSLPLCQTVSPADWQASFPRLNNPFPFHIQGTLIFSLNEQKRIHKISFNCTTCSHPDC